MKSSPGTVSRQTLYLAVLAALITGFVAGVGYSAYRSAARSAPQQQAERHALTDKTPAAEAIATLEKKAQADPDNAELWAELGHAFFDSGQADNAVAAYTRALAIAPDNPDVRTDLGVMYFQSKKYREAINEFDKVLRLDANHPQARFNKGVVLYSGLGDRAAALVEWKALLQTHPDAVTPTGMTLKELIRQVEEKKQ